jgi:endonuclease-3
MEPASAPFDIVEVMTGVREAVRPYPKAALFELAEEGHRTPFEILIACLVSIRTRDEVTLPASRRLFALARSPEAMSDLAAEAIDAAIHPATFHTAKALQISRIARLVLESHAGQLPCEEEALLALPGIGIKCAHLVLGIACDQPRVSVDVHVHRVTNRWGYVATRTPEETTAALEAKLPHRYWVEINALLVPFGKHICTGTRPFCSTCPVREPCAQVGVTECR